MIVNGRVSRSGRIAPSSNQLPRSLSPRSALLTPYAATTCVSRSGIRFPVAPPVRKKRESEEDGDQRKPDLQPPPLVHMKVLENEAARLVDRPKETDEIGAT